MSEANFEPGEGSRSIKKKEPLTRFLASLETTLSRKGRGCSEFVALGACLNSDWSGLVESDSLRCHEQAFSPLED
jgi:hypothetical protein